MQKVLFVLVFLAIAAIAYKWNAKRQAKAYANGWYDGTNNLATVHVPFGTSSSYQQGLADGFFKIPYPGTQE